jgi:hypothetical protein
VGGGQKNAATSLNATVAGGSGNAAGEHFGTVGGGTANLASGVSSTVGGGDGNQATASWSAVAGGLNNRATGLESSVGAGAGNRATAYGASVGGGLSNRASGSFSSVGGGRANTAGNPGGSAEDGAYATVAGGTENQASGAFSAVPGGDGNVAAGAHSLAAGHLARVAGEHAGTFLYADSTEVPFRSTAADEFAVRATGGVRLVTAVDAAGMPTAGVRLPAGSGSWEMLSDRAAKTAFSPIDPQRVLSAVAALPLSTWRYASESTPARHLGPTAQDFYAAFGLGSGDTTISAVDADGVALAAIQGLADLAKGQQARTDVLESQVASQGRAIAALEVRLAAGGTCRSEESGTVPAPLTAGSAGWAAAALAMLGAGLVVGRRISR